MTIRTIHELNGQFADNSIQAVTPSDIRDLVESLAVFGELGSGPKSTITVGTSVQALDFDVAGQADRGIVVNPTTMMITDTPVTLTLEMELLVLFRGTAGVDYSFRVFKNVDDNPEVISRMNTGPYRILNAAQTQLAFWKTTIDVNAGDSFQAGVLASAPGSNFELLQGVFRVQRKGVE